MNTEKLTIHMLKHIAYNISVQIKRNEAIDKALQNSLHDLDSIIQHLEEKEGQQKVVEQYDST